MSCRHCQAEIKLMVADLGSSPLSNSYLTRQALYKPEKWYPLHVLICEKCWLAQTEDFARSEEIFDAEYAYFSSYSTTWLNHCEQYVVNMIERFNLDSRSHVVEVAANDGYLLQFVKSRNIPCTGIEPTAGTAAVARAKGISIIEEFFGVELAKRLVKEDKQADLMTAINVLAHVPDINDFVAGFSLLLKPQGVATFEFPHFLKLIENNLFDTIYHEHYSYLSFSAVNRIFSANGLTIFDVEECPTHGGSLRVFAMRSDTGHYELNEKVSRLLRLEDETGMNTTKFYVEFQSKIDMVKGDILTFLIGAKRQGKTVGAYGAAAKGNTLLNYAGIRTDLISFVIDRNPAKQGKYLPGSRIPIKDESYLNIFKPDYLVILPWNLKDEIMKQLDYIRTWNGKFITAIPELEVIS